MTPHRKQVAILKETYRAKQNTTPTGSRRLVSLILCLCLFLSILPSGLMTTALAASGTDTAPDSGAAVTVTHKGSAVDSLSLPQDERTTLTAVCASDVTDASYQWQILADVASELWVNIYDATEQSLALSCALLNSLADDTGSAYVRCRVTASGQTIDSNVVCVTAARTIPVETGAEDEADANAAPTGRVPALRAPARAPAATSEEYVEITINYLDAVTGKSIYKSYQAQIEKGTGYTSTVISPAYLGYAPFYNMAAPSGTDTLAANDDATTIHLNILDSYSAPTYVVNVYYKAIDVPYAVRYYFQNIHDDTYSEDVGLYRVAAAKTGTIISDDKLKLSAGEAEGFTKLYHYPEAVAADGSTVFQCYYDRNYYMLKFDMDGGYGTEPVYARYGTAFIVTAPTRHGYVFAGWDDVTGGTGDGHPDTLPTTIPAENRTYKALWRTVDTTYTTVYWLQNADDDKYSFIGSVKGKAPSGTTVSGSDSLQADTPLCGNTEHKHNSDCYPPNFNQLVYNDEKTQKNVTIKGDGSTTVNVYYDRKAYTLRFFYAREDKNTHQFQLVGGTTYPFGNKGSDFTRPDPYNVENLLAKVKVTDWGNITDKPQLKDEYNGKYTKGTRDSNGYTYYYLELKARFDADLSALWPGDCFDPVPVAETHTTNTADQYMGVGQWGHYAYLAGWNGEFKVKYTLDHDNSTIKGMFQRLDENLLYGPDEVSEDSSNEINFLGYFCNGADVEWSKPWQWLYELYVPVLDGEESDLTYNYKGTNYKLIKTIDTADNNREISHQTQPTLHGFTVDDQQQQNNGVMSDGRESYTARFFYQRESYTLTLHNYNEAVSTVELPYQTPLDNYVSGEPTYPSTLEADAYTFGGWYYSSGCYEGTEYQPGDTMPAGDIALYAKWTPVTRTVRFFQTYDAMLAYEKTGSEAGLIEPKKVAHGTRVGSVDDPKDKSGHNYEFSGWFYMLAGKKTAYAPQDIPVTRDLNVFADWGSHTAQPYLVHYALHTGETETKWTEKLDTASGGTTPDNNQTFTVSVAGETRTYVYLTSDHQFHRQIAADSTGYAYQGNTRTFYPKVGDPLNELYADFNTGCYPTLASHSITVEDESDKTAPVKNVFTFTYAHTTSISYTVEYRYADNNELISSAPYSGRVPKSSDKAVVTERFAVIQDYIPDAFYKRLILAVKVDADGKVTSQDNVVVFYYTKNNTHAPYAVHHMLQTLDAALKDQSGLETDANGNYKYYAEDEARIQGIGETDSTLHVTPQTFSGFTAGNTGIQITTAGTTTTERKITLSGTDFPITIDRNGTDLYVFYTRSNQNYNVYYLKYGTPTTDLNKLVYNGDPAHTSGVLAAVKPDSGKFGQTVTEKALEIEGWSCVSDKQQTLLLRSDEKQNNIFFFYQPVQYSVDYQVWPQGGGTVSPSKEVVEGDTSFKGSTPTEKPGYRFKGWYLDENCTEPVTVVEGTVYSTTNRLVPNKSELEAMPKVNTFYAKFVPVLGDLTITRSNAFDEGKGDRVFVYRIKAAEDPSFELFVSIKGNGSVTIKNLFCFTYTIEQQNGWSWRYNDTSQTVKVTENNNQTVTFGSAPIKNKWLNGSSEREVNGKR